MKFIKIDQEHFVTHTRSGMDQRHHKTLFSYALFGEPDRLI
jgi:hypothetical protein